MKAPPRIARNAVASVSQVLASGLVMFVLYRYLLNTLGAERLGIWSVVLATTSASRIGELGLSASVTRFVAKYNAKGECQAAADSIQTGALSIAMLFALVLPASYPLIAILLSHIFPANRLHEALGILPFTLLSLAFATVAGIFQSGLDGCQRIDWRAGLVVFGQAIFLAASFWLAPRYGLIGLAWAQFFHALVLSFAGWFLLRRTLGGLPYFPYRWRRDSFREMLGYGLNVQLGSIAMMFFDPLTKALMGKFGGLAAAGYYEMANQFVWKARGLIVSVNQVLVPVVAGLNETAPERLKGLYRDNLRVLLYAVLPLHALIVIWSPLLSELWLGHYEELFVFFVRLSAMASFLNVFAGPAYFNNMGAGTVMWNTAAHIAMGVVNAMLGFVLGKFFAAEGIAWGAAIAITAGSTLIVTAYHIERSIPCRLLLPQESLGLMAACLIAIAVTVFSYPALDTQPMPFRFAVLLLFPVLLLIPPLWWHPLRIQFLGRIGGVSAQQSR